MATNPLLSSTTIAMEPPETGRADGSNTFGVVDNPNGGFVSRGRWIASPAGACTADSSMTGRANSGFVLKYQQDAIVPGGPAQIVFRAGDFTLHSTNDDWLVIAVAKAQFKDDGVVDGAGDSGFPLIATDGQVTVLERSNRFP